MKPCVSPVSCFGLEKDTENQRGKSKTQSLNHYREPN